MNIITITNQKGGVGKTTTAHILACALHDKGYKVLAIDTDPQTNLTYTAGITPEEAPATLHDVLKTKTISDDVIKISKAGYDIISGSLTLAGADMEFGQTGREYMLKKALEPLREAYDYCIIDTPPTLGILTINALTASNGVIIPMKADIYSIQGLAQLVGMIDNVKEYTNPDITIEGILLTQYSDRAVLNRSLRESIENTAKELNTKVFSSHIREAVAVRENAFLKADIFKEYPKAKVTDDYKQFVNELLENKGE